jgi:hypothetical protein
MASVTNLNLNKNDLASVTNFIAQYKQNCVRFQVLTAASMEFRVVWDVAPCSHVEVSELRTASIIRAVNALMMLQYAPLKRWSTLT